MGNQSDKLPQKTDHVVSKEEVICMICNTRITNKHFKTSNVVINATNEMRHKKCQQIGNQQTYNDEKYIINEISEDEDDEIQELMVTGTNQWQPIYEAWCSDEIFIDCIGQLRMCYKEPKYGYNMNCVGTGTVFWVSQSHKAFVITAAHNIKHIVRYCLICNKYMDIANMPRKNINNKIVNCCVSCGKPVTAKQYIQAKSIEFKRRSTHKHPYQDKQTSKTYQFGDNIHTYDPVKCEYIGTGNLSEPDGYSINCYQHCRRVNGGYDWAILSFNDDRKYYFDKCTHICIENGVNTMKLLKANDKCFNIFGIPGKGHYKNQLVGMKSIGTEYDINEHKKTHEYYLHHQVIDTGDGQSGSALWLKNVDGRYILFGVHTGSKIINNITGNVAVLFSDFAVSNIKKIVTGIRNDKPFAPIISIDSLKLNIKSNENDEIMRYKIRVGEKMEEFKADFEDEKTMEIMEWRIDGFDSSNTDITYDMHNFVQQRRLKSVIEYEIQVTAGNNEGYGLLSHVLSFVSGDFEIIAPVLFKAVGDVSKWMQEILATKYDNLYDDLKQCNASDLCELLNKIKNDTCKDFVKSNIFKQSIMQKNIGIFVDGCRKLGIDERDCIGLNVFDDKYNIVYVIVNLYAVSIISKKHLFVGPFITNCKQYKYKKNNKSNREKYIGGVNDDGKRHGIGKLIWYSGSIYIGEYQNGKWNGYGKYMFKNGNVYQGNWKDDKRHGYGKYLYKNGDIYEGNYKDDTPHGYGKETFANGQIYEGNFKNGERNGHGKYTFPNGKSYIGDWTDKISQNGRIDLVWKLL
eukprot:43228_1